MPSTFDCPACRRQISAEVAPGTQVRCPLCGEVVAVPGIAGAAPGAPVVPLSYRDIPVIPEQKGLAIGALVCGIIGMVSCPVVGLVGMVLGIVALVRASKAPTQYGGRGMAIGGICTGGLSLLSIPLFIAILLPALSRARELSMRTVCSANLRGIGQSLYIYAQDGGMFPEQGADWQARLINGGHTTFRQFTCPSDVGMMGASYHYVPGYGTSSNPRQIIAYDDPSIHRGEGGNILYQDGHVAFVGSPQFEAEIDDIHLPDGGSYAPHRQ